MPDDSVVGGVAGEELAGGFYLLLTSFQNSKTFSRIANAPKCCRFENFNLKSSFNSCPCWRNILLPLLFQLFLTDL